MKRMSFSAAAAVLSWSMLLGSAVAVAQQIGNQEMVPLPMDVLAHAAQYMAQGGTRAEGDALVNELKHAVWEQRKAAQAPPVAPAETK